MGLVKISDIPRSRETVNKGKESIEGCTNPISPIDTHNAWELVC